MAGTPPEVAITALAFTVFWLITVLLILVAGRVRPSTRGFADRMIAEWKPALVIAALFLFGVLLGGRSLLNPYAVAVFCQALIGLALASSIEGYEPLPLANAIIRRKQMLRQVLLTAVISLAVVVPALLVGTVGLDIGRQLFRETDYTREAANTLPPDRWRTFFLLLSGAGIAEETPFRLVLVSLVWKATKRTWPAIVLSALVFGAYHLTPLSGMYRVFWKFPLSQFTASTLIGLLWGYLFTKRGYETTVLGHTLSNWLPMLIFTS